jgi:DNA-binding Lrp family transcriptional regulator
LILSKKEGEFTMGDKATRQKEREKVLDLLKINGRMSAHAIGNELGCSRQKAWHILKELEEDHIIWGYTIVLGEKKLNRKHFILLVKRSNKLLEDSYAEKICSEDFISSMESHQDISLESLMCLHGSYDWLITLNAPDVVTVKSFISNLQINWGAYIDNVVMLESIDIIKKNWVRNPDIEQEKKLIKKLL